MAAWLMDGDTPEGFQIERECELKSSDEQKSVVRYARHALDIDEVRAHLTSGKMPTRLALSWKERVAFTLTETLTLKKISFLDLAFEGRPEVSGDESFDADLALATGELGTLIPALIEGLGGEHDFTAAALGTSASPATAPAVPAALPPSPTRWWTTPRPGTPRGAAGGRPHASPALEARFNVTRSARLGRVHGGRPRAASPGSCDS
jgi:recombination associated protein RdgC